MLLLEDIKKSVQVAAHYTTHIGIAPSSYLTGYFSLHTLTSISAFNIPSYPPLPKAKAGVLWRILKAAPHIPHVLYALVYEIVKVQSQTSSAFWIKSKLKLSA